MISSKGINQLNLKYRFDTSRGFRTPPYSLLAIWTIGFRMWTFSNIDCIEAKNIRLSKIIRLFAVKADLVFANAYEFQFVEA